MCSACDSAALPALGCPIRESAGHRLLNASPRLIAVVHALLRLLVPRHPPCALTILTVIKRRARGARRKDERKRARPRLCFLGSGCAVFKGRGEAGTGHPSSRGLSKLSSAPAVHEARPPAPVDVPRAGVDPRPRPASRTQIPRKEVIQPHLPVRLPCYDFTPVTGPTFDGSLPKGLGHRLRVLPTSVV
jgi:hypothetical protein